MRLLLLTLFLVGCSSSRTVAPPAPLELGKSTGRGVRFVMGEECDGYGGVEPGEFTLVYCGREVPGGAEQVPCRPACREWLFHFRDGVLRRTTLRPE